MIRFYEVLIFEVVRFILWLLEMRDLGRCYINGKAGCCMENLGSK